MNQNFNESKISKLILNNAIPATVSMIMVIIYNMADMFFIGQTKDPLQVAAVSLVTPAFMVFMALSNMFGIGGSSSIARSFGRGDNEYAKKVSAFCFWGAISVGVILGTLIIIFINPITVNILGASPSTTELTKEYLGILALGLPFVLISSAFANIIRAEGSPKVAMIGMFIGNITNIILDPIFILNMNLGILGAAIATVIGYIFASLFYILYFLRGNSKLSISLKKVTAKEGIAKGVISIGVPASLASILMSVAVVILNLLMSKHGDLAVAGIGVTLKITMITSLVSMGFGLGVQPVLGYLIGAKDEVRFKKAFNFSMLFSFGLASFMTIFCYLTLDKIIGAFLSEPSAYNYAMSFSRKMLSSSFLIGMFCVLMSAIQASGHAKPSLILSISRQGLIFIPMALILNKTLGIDGILYAQPITDVLSSLLAFGLFYRISKKTFIKKEDSIETIKIEKELELA